jgi:hypothetical protein
MEDKYKGSRIVIRSPKSRFVPGASDDKPRSLPKKAPVKFAPKKDATAGMDDIVPTPSPNTYSRIPKGKK